MKNASTLALAAALAIGLAASASAQSLAPTVPTPANPTPANPVATDGSPLGGYNAVRTGRSIAIVPPVGNYFGSAY